MIITQLTIDRSLDNSFQIRRDKYPKNSSNWHAHNEYELIYIFKGSGTLFIADKVITFNPGQCVLIGPKIPHYWYFNDLMNLDLEIDCIVIHFLKDFAGRTFFDIPELSELKNLLEESNKAFITNVANNLLEKKLNQLLAADKIFRVINFIEVLHLFAKENKKYILQEEYVNNNQEMDEKRINDVMHYIKNNFKQAIELEALAKQAKMSKNSFCRFFKQRTGKTPIQLVNEFRISNACNLLRNTSLNLKEICFESGFNNFVSFHKTFKSQLSVTPMQYKKEIKKKN